MTAEGTAVAIHTTGDTDSAGGEAYRLLRSTVKFATDGQTVRSVLVVDIDRPTPSGVAKRLAESFAQAGDRCAYVETDGRDGGREPGFAELIGGTALEAIIADSSDRRLAVIPAGRAATPDLLSDDHVVAALDRLRERYEYVILACAPLPQYADALALAPRVDAVILVASAGRTRRAKAVDARDALRRVGANILGVVLAEAKRGRPR